MDRKPPCILAIGEMLWDELPSGAMPGGAPLNFAWHCHQLGAEVVLISRVGADERGDALRELLQSWRISDRWLQTDATRPTGRVEVRLSASGEPSYSILENVAYDAIEWPPLDSEIWARVDAISYGTLAQRSPQSQSAIQFGLAHANPRLRICDLNLRPPFVDARTVQASIQAANWLKLNEMELPNVAEMLGLPGHSPDDWVLELQRREPQLQLVVQTLGEAGCRLWANGQSWQIPGVSVPVVDTVGAGDAFTAALWIRRWHGADWPIAALHATQYAALVVQHPGGTPRIPNTDFPWNQVRS
ncbi:carbohydrate kinase family protein [Tuwongella immobilis]|uniref:Carbohydrate kinase PfkB domain-containing protein n=1 Tax=Tuwongella immobilis TaxID=692036 RepID=A0A6C2YM27_9BACT|nr:carbohydrate kinase [Tuwongella immobilis]VIP02135.1 carbohydrate kinase : Sugar kinase, ribokinase OS=Singulisphaera acidiphila (strain ATCC BAA-1392 / DSM 18658 / VKM B-2454 / MOB10) GN=Sinac_3352 PE=4 SV=1: PfkB [Tuwongella immobilis]VTS00491.1 carbohydrate kinase : Sugar kinase, ribokinase OS=Singulisphaera acidiphila (strain ATCC BAA-1392 / DSM 18658 / VKM B-2454 / MOB10) GN=Sinac_3352 PE=4 SV=1: PfkB [Tuwongella immobilis]